MRNPWPTASVFIPGFALPFDKNHSASDYVLQFDSLESPLCLGTLPHGLLNGKCYYLGKNIREIPLDDRLFANDSHCMVGLSSKYLSLTEKGTGRSVRCKIEKFPYVLIWSMPGEPKFVCIEPWESLPSQEGGSIELERKARRRHPDSRREPQHHPCPRPSCDNFRKSPDLKIIFMSALATIPKNAVDDGHSPCKIKVSTGKPVPNEEEETL